MANQMNMYDAIKVLGIADTNVTQDIIKAAYRKASSKYHPDRNQAGLEMMKLVNVAFEVLSNLGENILNSNNTADDEYSEQINEALNAIIGLGLDIEICGAWVWVFGNTKKHKEKLKEANYRWSPKKLAWYFRVEEGQRRRRHKPWSMEQIRTTYGSKAFRKERELLAG